MKLRDKGPKFGSIGAGHISPKARGLARKAAVPLSGMRKGNKEPARALQHELLNQEARDAVREGRATRQFLEFVVKEAERVGAKGLEQHALVHKPHTSLAYPQVMVGSKGGVSREFDLKSLKAEAEKALKAGNFRS